MRYVATSGGVEEDVEDDFLDVWLSERPEGTGASLSFQRSLHEIDQDEVAMGMDSYCVSSSLGGTVYGPVRSVKRDGGLISFEFVPEDARLLGTDDTVEVELALDDELVAKVMAMLRRVLIWGRAESVPTLTGL